jgi:hypothetical protein
MNTAFQSRRHCLLLLFSLAALAGCGSAAAVEGQERIDFDKQVETVWKKNWDWMAAIPFIEKGGLFFDSGEPGDPTYDKKHILPLMKRVSSKHGVKWHAMVDKRNRSFALGVVGQLPDADGVRKSVMDTLLEEQTSFPLNILVHEGNRWMSLDFMTPEDAKFLEEGPSRK